MSTLFRFIIVSLLAVIAILSVRSCQQNEREIASIGTIQEIKDDSATYWRDRAGREHAEKRLAEGSISSIKIAFRGEIDSLKKILKAKEGALRSIVSSKTETKGQVPLLVDTVYVDSSKVYRFKYSDRWLTLQGEITKKSLVTYSVTDSITFVTYRKKTGLFRTVTFIDGFAQNPNTRITGLIGIRVTHSPTKRFGVGPYVGYGFNGTRWTPSAGISIQYALIKF